MAEIVETASDGPATAPPTKSVEPKLLLISDFEGCAPVGPPPTNIPQSRLLCSKAFFDSISAFMTSNPGNKVAFLGDYFDQGDLVVDTINYIMEVHKKFPERVHIILGNRDLNKLRLIYEMRETPQAVDEANKWSMWNAFYEKMAAATPLSLNARLLSIANNSMGAGGPIKIAPGLSAEESAYVLVRAFSNSNAELLRLENASDLEGKYAPFFENVRALFENGKIVVHDTDFKTMLSHAGGSDPFMFHTDKYYKTVAKKLRAVEQPDLPYYGKIEIVRKALQIAPTGDELATTFVADTYNSVLSTIKTMFDSKDEPTDDYFLLQGLGLKPDTHDGTAVTDGKTFTSFVQSCDVQGCKGPHGPDINLSQDKAKFEEAYIAYFKTLVKQVIHFIVHGHVPNCTPIPLIYKRADADGIIFVDNDTSNGYRPAAIDAINKIPLAYISTDGKAGIFSLDTMDTTSTFISETNEKGLIATITFKDKTTREPITKLFAPMVGEWGLTDAPVFKIDEAGPRIEYANGKSLTFPARMDTKIPDIFKPATMVDTPVPVPGGGKRRKTRKNSNRRRGGSTKKNRKSHGRKHR
jgi:hypothetical protein